MTTDLIPYAQVSEMAKAIAASGLFGIKRPEEALALMIVAQAEGRHPGVVARDYHIIHGRPALKSDAMMARFQEAGGKVRWLKLDDAVAEAEFSHPSGGEITIKWDMARAKQAEILSNAMWKKYPRQMLRARVISEGIRTVYPAVVCGAYSPEEVRDMADEESKVRPVQARVIDSAQEAVAQELPEPTRAPSSHVEGFKKHVQGEGLWKYLKEDEITGLSGMSRDDLYSLLEDLKDRRSAAANAASAREDESTPTPAKTTEAPAKKPAPAPQPTTDDDSEAF